MNSSTLNDLVSIPSDIFDRAKAGEIDFRDASLYIFLLLFSSTKESVYYGTPESLSAILTIPKIACRKSILSLERQGFIRVIRKKQRSLIEICTDFSNPFRCRKYRPTIPAKIRNDVLSRGSCVLCGSIVNLTVDHIVAYSKGGAHDISNFQCLCAKCNRKKWCN